MGGVELRRTTLAGDLASLGDHLVAEAAPIRRARDPATVADHATAGRARPWRTSWSTIGMPASARSSGRGWGTGRRSSRTRSTTATTPASTSASAVGRSRSPGRGRRRRPAAAARRGRRTAVRAGHAGDAGGSGLSRVLSFTTRVIVSAGRALPGRPRSRRVGCVEAQVAAEPAASTARGRAPVRSRSLRARPASGTARGAAAARRAGSAARGHRAVAALDDRVVVVGECRHLRQVGDHEDLAAGQRASRRPISTAALPPTPASTSSKIIVGTGWCRPGQTSMASITRESSPPDAPCEGRGSPPRAPRTGTRRRRRRRARTVAAARSRGLGWRTATSNDASGIASSASSAVTYARKAAGRLGARSR